MKFPNHIILDLAKQKVSYSTSYWIYTYMLALKKNLVVFEDFTFQKKFLLKKENLILNVLLSNQKKFTIRYSLSNPSLFFSENKKKLFKNLFTPKTKVKSKVLYSKEYTKEIYDYLIKDKNDKTKNLLDEKFFKRLINNFKFKNNAFLFKNNKIWNLFDINFLRKEKMYTKLKYSRVPQYDIVSGGSAALLAGFFGFLICEKFGFELADSGDFYILFMYIVFACVFLRIFFKLTSGTESSWNPFSLKWLFLFLLTIVSLFLKRIYNFFFK